MRGSKLAGVERYIYVVEKNIKGGIRRQGVHIANVQWKLVGKHFILKLKNINSVCMKINQPATKYRHTHTHTHSWSSNFVRFILKCFLNEFVKKWGVKLVCLWVVGCRTKKWRMKQNERNKNYFRKINFLRNHHKKLFFLQFFFSFYAFFFVFHFMFCCMSFEELFFWVCCICMTVIHNNVCYFMCIA